MYQTAKAIQNHHVFRLEQIDQEKLHFEECESSEKVIYVCRKCC